MNDPELTPRQYDALRILQEECAEVTHVASKVCRFGVGKPDRSPRPETNVRMLEIECGQLLAMIEILIEEGLLTPDGLEDARNKKRLNIHNWSNL